MNWFKSFFIFCSGADKELLYECPGFEQNKYAGVGGTVFFTAVFAWLSGGYALNRVFYQDSTTVFYISVILGFCWACLIFNLDRYIVSSMRKTGKWWEEWSLGVPRLLIAIVISLVIAKPLEVKIFERLILRQISNNALAQKKLDNQVVEEAYELGSYQNDLETVITQEEEAKDELKQKPSDAEYLSLLEQKKNIDLELTMLKKQEGNLQSRVSHVFRGKTYYDSATLEYKSATLLSHLEPADRSEITPIVIERNKVRDTISDKEKTRSKINSEINRVEKDYAQSKRDNLESIKNQRKRKQKEMNAQDSIARAKIDSLNKINDFVFTENFIVQVEALGDLTSWEEDEKDENNVIIKKANNTMWWVGKMIMILFILIETAPILVKLLSKLGPYDQLVEICNSTIISKVGHQLITNTENALKKELDTNKKLLDKISTAQLEIAEQLIEKWKRKELGKMKNNDVANEQHIAPPYPQIES